MTQRQKGFLYVNVFNNIQYVKGRFERREDEEIQFFFLCLSTLMPITLQMTQTVRVSGYPALLSSS